MNPTYLVLGGVVVLLIGVLALCLARLRAVQASLQRSADPRPAATMFAATPDDAIRILAEHAAQEAAKQRNAELTAAMVDAYKRATGNASAPPVVSPAKP